MNKYVLEIIDLLENKNENYLENLINNIGDEKLVRNELLQVYGISNVKIRDLKKILKVMYVINEKELNVSKVLNENSKLFNYTPEHIGNTIDTLYTIFEKYGLNARKVMNNHPYLLTAKTETIEENLEYLVKLNIDLARAIERYGSMLGGKGLREKVEFLSRMGADVKTLIERKGVVLSLNFENNIKPKIEYLISEVGIDSKTIIDLATLLTASLEKRIKPRWEELRKYNVNYNSRKKMYLLMQYTDNEFNKEINNLKKLDNDMIKVINYSDEEIDKRLNDIRNNAPTGI